MTFKHLLSTGVKNKLEIEVKIACRKVKSKVKFVFLRKIEADVQKCRLGAKEGRVHVRGSVGKEMQFL